jgi:hypothetical protein
MGRHPKFRFILHGELNKKLKDIGERFSTLSDVNHHNLENGKSATRWALSRAVFPLRPFRTF